jgi:hypothetical protein
MSFGVSPHHLMQNILTIRKKNSQKLGGVSLVELSVHVTS